MHMEKFNNKIEIYSESLKFAEMLKEWKELIQLKHPVNFYKHKKNRKT